MESVLFQASIKNVKQLAEQHVLEPVLLHVFQHVAQHHPHQVHQGQLDHQETKDQQDLTDHQVFQDLQVSQDHQDHLDLQEPNNHLQHHAKPSVSNNVTLPVHHTVALNHHHHHHALPSVLQPALQSAHQLVVKEREVTSVITKLRSQSSLLNESINRSVRQAQMN